jgi:hypothetical protein
MSRPPPLRRASLSVGDGFKFGCGFTVALLIVLLGALLLAAAVALVANLLGVDPRSLRAG